LLIVLINVTGPRRHLRKRADRVVGLDAGHAQHGPAEQLDHFEDRLHLLHQRVGHRGARGLVLRVPLVANGRALVVEHAGGVVRLHVLQALSEHRDHAVDGTGGKTVLRAAQVRHRVVCAVQIAGSVDQQQCLFTHACIVNDGHKMKAWDPDRRSC
jgi:hypothetical protein